MDEQTLSREAWSVEPAVNAERQLGLRDRVRALYPHISIPAMGSDE